MKNEIKKLLISLGVSDKNSVFQYHPRVRDRKGIKVMKCRKSGVIFLSRTDHLEQGYYKSKQGFNYWLAKDREQAKLIEYSDTLRRSKQFRELIIGKKWLDIGTGTGGILDSLGEFAIESWAVEPQEGPRKVLKKLGYNICADVKDLPVNKFEIVTLFHVFEHFVRPIKTLNLIKDKMVAGGKIVVEVPHAGDFLLSFLELNSFKDFTFWSEHVILHTRESLKIFLERAGFKNINIMGFQRYPLANHLYWLAKGRPGGHTEWPFLRDEDIDRAYVNLLKGIDKTDTLIAFAEK